RSSTPAPTTHDTATRRVQGYINIVPKWAAYGAIGRNHRLVVEVVRAAGEAEEGGAAKGLSAVSRFGYRQLSSVDAVASAEEYDNVAVEEISPGVEYQTRIGSETGTIRCVERRRKRRVHSVTPR